jgi:hypothetical protein
VPDSPNCERWIGDTRIDLNYFSDSRTIELSIMNLTATHLRILGVLDFCLDRHLMKSEQWVRSTEEIYRRGRAYNDRYRARYGLNETHAESG